MLIWCQSADTGSSSAESQGRTLPPSDLYPHGLCAYISLPQGSWHLILWVGCKEGLHVPGSSSASVAPAWYLRSGVLLKQLKFPALLSRYLSLPKPSPQPASLASLFLRGTALLEPCVDQTYLPQAKPPPSSQSSDLKACCGLSFDSIRLSRFHSTKKQNKNKNLPNQTTIKTHKKQKQNKPNQTTTKPSSFHWLIFLPLLPESPPTQHTPIIHLAAPIG